MSFTITKSGGIKGRNSSWVLQNADDSWCTLDIFPRSFEEGLRMRDGLRESTGQRIMLVPAEHHEVEAKALYRVVSLTTGDVINAGPLTYEQASASAKQFTPAMGTCEPEGILELIYADCTDDELAFAGEDDMQPYRYAA